MNWFGSVRFVLYCVTSALLTVGVRGADEGFMEPPLRIYGKVVQSSAGTNAQLFSGELMITFEKVADPSVSVSVKTALQEVGPTGAYSYLLEVPQRYLPAAERLGSVLEVQANRTDYRLRDLTVDGIAVEPLNPDQELIPTSFSRRGAEYRLDLQVRMALKDTDGDGIPDWWEEQHELNPLFAGDADTDKDADGVSNADEYSRGTDPSTPDAAVVVLTTGLVVTELGVSGLWLDAPLPDGVDAAATIMTADAIPAGFEVWKDGVAMTPGAMFSLGDVRSGRMAVRHVLAGTNDGTLSLSWAGGNVDLQVTTFLASETDGNDASLWLDGKSITASVGQPIATWTDRSGNQADGIQDAAAEQPAVSADGIAQFGAGRHLLLPESGLPSGDRTIIIMHRTTVENAAQTILGFNKAEMGILSSADHYPYPGAAVVADSTEVVEASTAVDGGFQVLSFQSGGTQFGGRADADSRALKREVTGPAVAVQPALGARVEAGAGIDQPYLGEVAEVLTFPRLLSSARVSRIEDYLRSRWQGVPVWDLQDETHPVDLSLAGAAGGVVRGGWAMDVIGGGAGDDVIAGGPGDDILSGGAGADRFVYGTHDGGIDFINDFDPAEDVLDLAALFPTPSSDLAGAIQFVTDGQDTRIVVTGTSAGALELVLVGAAYGNEVRDRWIGEGILQVGQLVPSQTIAISTQNGVALESDPEIAFRLTRSGSTAYELAVPLNLGGSAVRGADYAGFMEAGQSVRPIAVFARGESECVVTVAPIGNHTTEGERTLTVGIVPQYGYAISADAPEGAVVLDDAPASVGVTVVSPATIEGDAVKGELRITRQGPIDSVLQVRLEVLGSATNGVDYPFIPNLVSFAAGVDEVMLMIDPYLDQNTEEDETVEVIVQAGDYAIQGDGRGVVTISDRMPRISISAAVATAERASGQPGTFLISRSGNLLESMVVSLNVAGNAENGVDYEYLAPIVSFEPGFATMLVNVMPRGEVTYGGNETVTMEVQTNANCLIDGPALASVTIVDDAASAPVVSISTGTTTVAEGSAAQAVIRLARTGPSDTLLAVNLGFSGTAENGVDYSGIPSTLAIPPGAAHVDVALMPLEDEDIERLEIARIDVLSGNGYAVGNASAVEIAVEDMFERVFVEAEIPVANLQQSGRFLFSRNRNIANPLSVNVVVSGSATAGVDYQALTLPVTFPAHADTVAVDVNALDSGAQKQLTVQATVSESNPFQRGFPYLAVVTIDPPVGAAAAVARAVESRVSIEQIGGMRAPGFDEPVAFVAKRTGDLSGDLTVELLYGGMLKNGVDYEYLPRFLSFAPGEAEKRLDVKPITWKEGGITVALASGKSYSAARSANVVEVTREGRVVLSLQEGWNLVSIPFVEGPTVDELKEMAPIRQVWGMRGRRFFRVSELVPMVGYWVHAEEHADVELFGTYKVEGYRKDAQGWKLVGPLLDGVTTADAAEVFQWDMSRKRYVRREQSLVVGAGYLVFSKEHGLKLGL